MSKDGEGKPKQRDTFELFTQSQSSCLNIKGEGSVFSATQIQGPHHYQVRCRGWNQVYPLFWPDCNSSNVNIFSGIAIAGFPMRHHCCVTSLE